MSQQYSWPTHSWPLEGRCLYYALLGLTQAPGFAGGPDLQTAPQARFQRVEKLDTLKKGQQPRTAAYFSVFRRRYSAGEMPYSRRKAR